MSQPDKCECHKLVIALLDRAEGQHQVDRMMLETLNAYALDEIKKLKAENERLRKAGDALVEVVDESEIKKARWFYGKEDFDPIGDWQAAKGVQL